MLLNHDQRDLSILRSHYNFSNEQAGTDWDRSVQFLKELGDARGKLQNTHLEGHIEVFTENPDDQASLWDAWSWSWHIGNDWERRGSVAGRKIDGVNYIRYYAGTRDAIHRKFSVSVLDLKSDQDWKKVTEFAIETLV